MLDIYSEAYEDANSQYLLSELTQFIKLDEDTKKEYLKGTTEEEVAEELTKMGYNIELLYHSKGSYFGSLKYLGHYVATEVYSLEKEHIRGHFGFERVSIRENLFKEMFLDGERLHLVFNREYNTMPLYYFIKLYKEIRTDIVYDLFKYLYFNMCFGFEKFPNELLEYVFSYKSSTIEDVKKEILSSIKDMEETRLNFIEEDLKRMSDANKVDDVLTIYRGEGAKSNKSEDLTFSSWSLSRSVAKRFTHGDGTIYVAEIKLDKVLDFIGTELEVLCKKEDIENKRVF